MLDASRADHLKFEEAFLLDTNPFPPLAERKVIEKERVLRGETK